VKIAFDEPPDLYLGPGMAVPDAPGDEWPVPSSITLPMPPPNLRRGTFVPWSGLRVGSRCPVGSFLMKSCHHCGGRFGLVRHRHYTLQFCTARCLEIWKRVQSDKARQHRFLEWLLPGVASLAALPTPWPGMKRVECSIAYPDIVADEIVAAPQPPADSGLGVGRRPGLESGSIRLQSRSPEGSQRAA
jgi:hypothetical protein